jgi:GNAT superfamily N-acetyltransferase
MPRSAVSVRTAVPDDLPVLLAVWAALPAVRVRRHPRNGGPRLELHPGGAALESRYLAAMEATDQRLFVACLDHEPAGVALVCVEPAAVFADAPSVAVHHLVVAERFRRRGVGRALLRAAASFADSCGAETLTVEAPSSDRLVNRFYARLGFAPTVTRRMAPVAALRRQPTLPEAVAGPAGAVGPVVPTVDPRRMRLRHPATAAQARLLARRRELPRTGGG